MSTIRRIALPVAVMAALAAAAGPAAATTVSPPPDEFTSLSSDRISGDSRPPTTGPTNPAQNRV